MLLGFGFQFGNLLRQPGDVVGNRGCSVGRLRGSGCLGRLLHIGSWRQILFFHVDSYQS